MSIFLHSDRLVKKYSYLTELHLLYILLASQKVKPRIGFRNQSALLIPERVKIFEKLYLISLKELHIISVKYFCLALNFFYIPGADVGFSRMGIFKIFRFRVSRSKVDIAKKNQKVALSAAQGLNF